MVARRNGCKVYREREQSLVWKLLAERWEDNNMINTYMASGPSHPPKTVSLVSMFESPAVIVAHLCSENSRKVTNCYSKCFFINIFPLQSSSLFFSFLKLISISGTFSIKGSNGGRLGRAKALAQTETRSGGMEDTMTL